MWSSMPMLGLGGQASGGTTLLGIGNQPRKQGARLRSDLEERLCVGGMLFGNLSLGWKSDARLKLWVFRGENIIRLTLNPSGRRAFSEATRE